MKKFALAAVTAAVTAGWTGMAMAVVDLDLDTGSVPYANELVVNNTTPLAGVVTTNKLGFGVSGSQTRYVRYDMTNAKFAAVVAPTALLLAPAATNTIVSQGGAVGGQFVVFQITSDPAGNDQASAVQFTPGNLVVTDKSGSASVKYSLYETAEGAQLGGTLGLLATATGPVATFPSGLTFAAVTNSSQAEVSTLYTQFNNGVTSTIAKIGTVTYAPNEAVFNPATGVALTAADMALFTAAGTKLVLTGSDLTAATTTNGVYLAEAGSTCSPFGGIAGTNVTATTADFVTGALAVGTSPAIPPNTGRDICFAATGTKPIAAQGFTVATTVVPVAGTTTTNKAAIPAGAFTRNGTVLKAAFADTTSASGVTMAVHMTNTGGIPAPYTVRCLLPSSSVAGTPGVVPANTARRESVTGGMGCPADGTMRGIELTFAVPEGSVIGSMVRQNVSTGAASFDSMVGSK